MTDAIAIHGGDVPAEREAPLLPLREDLDVFDGPRTPLGAPTWVIHDPVRNRFFNIGQLEFEALMRWRGTAAAVAGRVNRETSLRTSPRQIEALEAFCNQNQLVRDDRAGVGRQFAMRRKSMLEAPSRSKWLLHNYLFFRIPLFRPDAFLTRTLPRIRFVYSRAFHWLVIAVAIVGLVLVTRQWESFLSTFPYVFSLEGMVLFGLAIVFTKVVHELGHAYTVKYYGLRVPTMGVAFLVMFPVMYTDTSDAWKLSSRRGRLAIGAAGILSELMLAAFATLLWSFLPDGPLRSAVFFVAAVSWLITLAINLNPFLRWDGYYLLADYLGIQNLQPRAFAYGRWWLRERLFALGDAPPERFPARTRRIVVLYAYATWLYRLFLFLGIAVLVYTFLFKVAGIILATVELAWFIGRPIYQEVSYWCERRADMRWNGNTRTSALFFLLLILLLVVPWQSSIEIPALLRPVQHAKLYSPMAGRIVDVRATNGDRAEANEVLFVLETPNLDFDISKNRTRIAELRLALSRQSTQELELDQRQVLERQLAAEEAELEGLMAQKARLEVVAPFAGEIFNIPDGLKPDRWVNEDLLLGLIVDRSGTIVEGYVSERQIQRLANSSSGRFYPDNTEVEPLPVVIDEIDASNVLALEEPYSASLYGGKVAVTRDEKDRLVTHNAVFRIRLLPDAGTAGVPSPDRMLRGTVVLKAEPKSLVARAWQFVSAVFIRESGF